MLTKGNDKNNSIAYDYSSSCAFYMFAVLVVLLCQGVAGVAAAAIETRYEGASSGGIFNTACMIFFQAANFAFIYFYTRIYRRKLNFSYIKNASGQGVTPKTVILPILLAAILMCGMYLPTVWYGYFTQAIGIPADAGALELNSAGATVMIVIASVFLAPAFEETIYRGVLLNGLKNEFSVTKSVMLSAVAFMMMHMSPLQVVFQFALGVLSGYLAIKTERLLPSVILHAVANALALVIQLTPLAAALDGSVLWLTQHIAAAVLFTILFAAVSFALCFLLLRYAFDKTHWDNHGAVETGKDESKEIAQDEDRSENHAQQIMREQVMANITRRDGLVKYFIGIGICAVMFVINLVSLIML